MLYSKNLQLLSSGNHCKSKHFILILKFSYHWFPSFPPISPIFLLGVVQAVEHVFCKSKALSSNPVTTPKKGNLVVNYDIIKI
jgi:hypothetical protein